MRKYCSNAFMLSDRYEEVMSKFNFPRPVEDRAEEPNTSTREQQHRPPELGLPSASMIQSPLQMDFTFMDGMFEWDLFATTPLEIGGIADDSILYGIGLADDPHKLSRIKDLIMSAASVQRLGSTEKVDIKAKIDRMLTASQVSACIACYFRGWHRNCRTVHEPTFSTGTAHNGLLVAMIFLGAMYSPDSDIRRLSGDLIEHVESYIFGQETLASLEDHEPHRDTPIDFDVVHSAFVMVVIQFWTGNKAARRRAATKRFTSVVQVRKTTEYAKRLNLINVST